jgi:hypothetical protein
MQGPSWEINGPCGSRGNIFYFWYLRAHYCVHTCPSWLCILPQTNPVQNPQIISLKTICTNVSQAVSFFQVFYPNLCVHFSLSRVLHDLPIALSYIIYQTVIGIKCCFLGYENWHIIKFFCPHKHKTLTILSLTAGIISSALCNRILGIPVAKECRNFHNLETFFITRFVCCKNPSDRASYF